MNFKNSMQALAIVAGLTAPNTTFAKEEEPHDEIAEATCAIQNGVEKIKNSVPEKVSPASPEEELRYIKLKFVQNAPKMSEAQRERAQIIMKKIVEDMIFREIETTCSSSFCSTEE